MNQVSSLSFKIVSSLDELAMALFVRGCVFVEEMEFPYEEEFDGTDSSAFHVLALEDGEPIGTSRVRYLDGAARLERICVRKSYRGQGLGDRLLSYTLSAVDQSGYKRSSVFADGRLVGWYRNHGFEIEREVTYANGTEGFEMLRVPGGEEPKPKSSPRLDSISKPTPKSAPEAQEGKKICAVSGEPFEVTDEDREYYDKIGVPEPTPLSRRTGEASNGVCKSANAVR